MKKYFVLSGLLLLISCKRFATEPLGLNFYFENPQPTNDTELSKFPSKFKGLYVNNDSVFLRIDHKLILLELYDKFRINKVDLDSLKEYYSYSNGKLTNLKTNEITESKMIGDSLEIIDKTTDTLFSFSNSQKAKRINGFLVLNTKDSIFWKIRTISLEKNILKLKYIYSEEDLKKLDSVLKEKPKMIDSSSFIFRPTRKEFKKILNLKNFGDDQEFKKVLK